MISALKKKATMWAKPTFIFDQVPTSLEIHMVQHDKIQELLTTNKIETLQAPRLRLYSETEGHLSKCYENDQKIPKAD